MDTKILHSQLHDTVKRIVEAVHPMKIILFSSSARNERTPHSDYDLLVIMPDGVNCNQLMGELYVHAMNQYLSFDFIVITESLLQQHQSNPGLIYQNALNEGIELYAA